MVNRYAYHSEAFGVFSFWLQAITIMVQQRSDTDEYHTPPADVSQPTQSPGNVGFRPTSCSARLETIDWRIGPYCCGDKIGETTEVRSSTVGVKSCEWAANQPLLSPHFTTTG